MAKMKTVRRTPRHTKFWDAVLETMSGSAVFGDYHSPSKPRNPMSDMSELRSDWDNIGRDFRVAIKKAYEAKRPSAKG